MWKAACTLAACQVLSFGGSVHHLVWNAFAVLAAFIRLLAILPDQVDVSLFQELLN
jgi:hypothetical protein